MADGYRIGVDIGGTFTDVVLLGADGTAADDEGALDAGRLRARRRRRASSSCSQEHRRRAGERRPRSSTRPRSPRTRCSKGKGAAAAASLTTAGFRDVLEMRRLRIPVMYDLQYEKPPPLVPRRLRYEIPERIGPRGEEWAELDEEAVRDAARAGSREQASRRSRSASCTRTPNPAHERRVAEIVREVVGDDVYVTCSSEILAEIREYERTSTAVVNAYVGPAITRYLGSLESSGCARPGSRRRSRSCSRAAAR